MNEKKRNNAEKKAEARAPRPTKVNKKNTNNDEKYVLYADIMGFKEKVMRTKHADLKKELKGLRAKLDDWFSPFLENVKTFKVSFFSDSILIVEESSPLGFQRISIAAVGLMQLSLHHKFPIKGAIAKGEFTYEEKEQLFFGQAIIDAFLLEEQIHYYGIVAHHTMEEDIKKYSNGMEINALRHREESNPYILSPIPLKNGKITHYHLACNLLGSVLKIEDATITNKRFISWLEGIYGTVSGAPRIYVDNTLRVLEEDLRLYEETLEKLGEVEFPLKAFR